MRGTSTPATLNGGAAPWTPPVVQQSRPGGMPIVNDRTWVVRLVVLAIMFAVGWAGQWYLWHRPHTVEAQDGTFKVTYSSYWDEVDMEGLPPVPGFSPDLAIENESSGVFMMHMPAPPGSEQALARGLNSTQLEQILAASPWPGKLKSSTSPGTTTIAGKAVALEAKATVDSPEFKGRIDLLVAISPDQSVLMMILHGCDYDECSKSSGEFKDLLESIEFASVPEGAF
jgi:hypothetical protein